MKSHELQNDEPRSSTRIQSVSRAMQLLHAIAESQDGETAKRLSEQTGLTLATTYHLLTTLQSEGLLTKDDLRVFRLGPRVGAIAEAYQRLDSVPAEYHRALHRVARLTGETAYLGVWRNNGVRVLDKVEGTHAVRVVGLDTGFTEDMHARASAKLLLAFAAEDLRQAITDGLRLRRLAPNTITRKNDLLKEFERIREMNIAFDREEFQIGVICVSAPIWRGDSVAACITVSSPSQRFNANEEAIISALTEVVESLRR